MLKESFAGRRTFPRNPDNHGEANNRSDAPTVQIQRLKELSAFVPAGLGNTPQGGLVETNPASSKGYVPTRGIRIIPLEKQPLTPIFKTSHGGRRVGGGGTSREALRRAKRKSRSANRKR